MITSLSQNLNVDSRMMAFTVGVPTVSVSTNDTKVKVSGNVRLYSDHNKVKITHRSESSVCRVYIPMLMSGIKHEKAKITTESINLASVILNDSSCKPVFNKKVKTQNFMTLSGKSSETGWSNMSVGTQVYCKSDLNRINTIRCELIS